MEGGGGQQQQQHAADSQGLNFGVSSVSAGTFTCNPNWPEVLEALLPGQHSNDGPDIIARGRLFQLKLLALLEDLLQDHVLGRTMGHCYTIEFQKRGQSSVLEGELSWWSNTMKMWREGNHVLELDRSIAVADGLPHTWC